jgi:hypothetical protein
MFRIGAIGLAFALGLTSYPTQDVLADGVAVVRPAKKRAVHVAPRCLRDQCGYPMTCPDGTCHSLYGAYGPYGGFHYWSRYSYGGWGHR